MPSTPAAAGSSSEQLMSQWIFGSPRDLDPVEQVLLAGRPVRGDIPRHPGHVLDRDGLAAVDDTGRPDPHAPAGAGLDRPAGDLEGPLGLGPLERLADVLELDPEGIGHQADATGPLVQDRTGRRDKGLEVHRASEAHSVHHHVRDGIVVVEPDLVGSGWNGWNSTGSSAPGRDDRARSPARSRRHRSMLRRPRRAASWSR